MIDFNNIRLNYEIEIDGIILEEGKFLHVKNNQTGNGLIFKIEHGTQIDGRVYFNLDAMHAGRPPLTRQLTQLNDLEGIRSILARDYIEFVVLDDIESNPFNAEIRDRSNEVSDAMNEWAEMWVSRSNNSGYSYNNYRTSPVLLRQ